MKETKDSRANSIIQRTITNPSVEIMRCSLQVISVKHDKMGHHYTLSFSQDTVDALSREGKLIN